MKSSFHYHQWKVGWWRLPTLVFLHSVSWTHYSSWLFLCEFFPLLLPQISDNSIPVTHSGLPLRFRWMLLITEKNYHYHKWIDKWVCRFLANPTLLSIKSLIWPNFINILGSLDSVETFSCLLNNSSNIIPVTSLLHNLSKTVWVVFKIGCYF